jgi:hypothetical protein
MGKLETSSRLRKITKNITQGKSVPGRDLNRAHPEYKSEPLPHESRSSVGIVTRLRAGGPENRSSTPEAVEILCTREYRSAL